MTDKGKYNQDFQLSDWKSWADEKLASCIFVMGEVCSGKDTFAKQWLKDDFESRRWIDLGTLVRHKHNTAERVFDANLDEYLVKCVSEIGLLANEVGIDEFLITGVRQPNLLKKLSELFLLNDYKYLSVPRQILQERFEKRGAKKDRKTTFHEVIERDNKLGMSSLQDYLLLHTECEFVKNY